MAEVEQLMFWIYALYNKKHNKIYIGQTRDLEEREYLRETALFKNCYTSRYDGDWALIYKKSTITREQALKREKQLKSYQGRLFIKKFIPL